MKILVFGAGVLGCNLARNFLRAGKDVTLLARGKWAEEIQKNGLRIKDKFSPRVSVSRIPVVTELKPEDKYDVIFVVMRYTQIDAIKDTLHANGTKNIVFVGNNVSAAALAGSFPEKNVIFAFALVVASSIGADLAMAFLTETELPVGHAFFDGGQFAQIGKGTRRLMTPFLYLAIRSLYLSKGKTLKKIMWCDDDAIKPYFIAAGKALKYGNLRRQLSDSLEDKPFPPLPQAMQRNTYFEFGSIEEHYKYRDAVMKAYPYANYPIFDGFNHMQYQIRDPHGFAEMLASVIEKSRLPKLPFLKG